MFRKKSSIYLELLSQVRGSKDKDRKVSFMERFLDSTRWPAVVFLKLWKLFGACFSVCRGVFGG